MKFQTSVNVCFTVSATTPQLHQILPASFLPLLLISDIRGDWISNGCQSGNPKMCVNASKHQEGSLWIWSKSSLIETALLYLVVPITSQLPSNQCEIITVVTNWLKSSERKVKSGTCYKFNSIQLKILSSSLKGQFEVSQFANKVQFIHTHTR